MPELLEEQEQLDRHAGLTSPERTLPTPGIAPYVETDESASRRTLLKQIASLEGQLSEFLATAFPRQGFNTRVATADGGPRVLSLGDLERTRDALASRLEEQRRELDKRTEVEERNRRKIEEMMLEPERFKWAWVSNEDIGERGCKHWQVQPRYGVLGLFFNWWRVRISSGCPLAGGRGPWP
jgi:hypothetical protein